MKIAFIGDCDYNTGPSNVNKDFKRYLSDRVYFLKHRKKALRAAEVSAAVMKADAVIISGLSIINQLALNTAILFKKPVVYLMHGCYAYESEINGFQKNEKALRLERKMLDTARKIITVSEQYMGFVASYFPQHKEKLAFINNGIEWSNVKETDDGIGRDPYLVLSMGGGRPQKNNIVVCEAVLILNEQYHEPFRYAVLGRDYEDTPAIKQSPYTNYVGQVSRQKVDEWLKKASVYVQDSSFEPFGLAPIEALCMGCNLLVSRNVGAISILSSISQDDVIADCRDAKEIARKILKVSKDQNQSRLLAGINRETSSCEYASRKLMDIVSDVLKGEKSGC